VWSAKETRETDALVKIDDGEEERQREEGGSQVVYELISKIRHLREDRLSEKQMVW